MQFLVTTISFKSSGIKEILLIILISVSFEQSLVNCGHIQCAKSVNNEGNVLHPVKSLEFTLYIRAFVP